MSRRECVVGEESGSLYQVCASTENLAVAGEDRYPDRGIKPA